MMVINMRPDTKQAIEELRRMADMLENGEAMLTSGTVDDTKRYGEPRERSIDITVILD